MQKNLAQLVAQELRKRGNKDVKSMFWNKDAGNLSVILKSHTFDKPTNFNYTPDAILSVTDIANYIEKRNG